MTARISECNPSLHFDAMKSNKLYKERFDFIMNQIKDNFEQLYLKTAVRRCEDKLDPSLIDRYLCIKARDRGWSVNPDLAFIHQEKSEQKITIEFVDPEGNSRDIDSLQDND